MQAVAVEKTGWVGVGWLLWGWTEGMQGKDCTSGSGCGLQITQGEQWEERKVQAKEHLISVYLISSPTKSHWSWLRCLSHESVSSHAQAWLRPKPPLRTERLLTDLTQSFLTWLFPFWISPAFLETGFQSWSLISSLVHFHLLNVVTFGLLLVSRQWWPRFLPTPSAVIDVPPVIPVTINPATSKPSLSSQETWGPRVSHG